LKNYGLVITGSLYIKLVIGPTSCQLCKQNIKIKICLLKPV
jgi:hypothetical protein